VRAAFAAAAPGAEVRGVPEEESVEIVAEEAAGELGRPAGEEAGPQVEKPEDAPEKGAEATPSGIVQEQEAGQQVDES